MRARNLNELAKSLEERAASIPLIANRLAIHVAQTIVKELATKTPVDTSKAISNWQVTLNAPATAEINAHYEGSKGSTYGLSSAETIALCRMVLRGKKPGQAIFITNNASYISDLNDGSSMQAPAGFVQAAVYVGIKSIAKTV